MRKNTNNIHYNMLLYVYFEVSAYTCLDNTPTSGQL